MLKCFGKNTSILADIVKKTRNGVIAPNLVKDSPESLLEELIDIKDFINDPEEVFQPFIPESAKEAVQMQVQTHKENIWLAYQNGDYKLAKTKLDELTDLNNVLKLPTIENEYNDCVKNLTNEWNKKIEDAKSIFNKRIASPHSISKGDVLIYQKVVTELVSANELQSHLKDTICGESLIQNIHEQMRLLSNAIEDEKEGNESILQIHLDKIAQVQTCFPDFRSSYNEACQKLKKRVVNCVDEAKECITKNKFLEFRKELEKIGRTLILQEHLGCLIDIKKEIKDLENELLIHLHNAINEGFVVLKKTIKEEFTTSNEEKHETEKIEIANIRIEQLDKTAVDILKRIVPFLEEAANAFDLPYEHVGLDKSTKELVRSFVDEIIGYFEKITQKILYLFEKQRYQTFDEIKRTGSQYYQTIETMFGFVQKDIDTILDSFNKPKVSFDYNRLYECVVCINQSEWIDERLRDGSSNLKETVKQILTLHLHELQQSSQELELDLDHPELLEEARNIFIHLGNLRRLEVIIPELAPFREKVSVPLEQSVRATLATIRREFALGTKNVPNYEKMRRGFDPTQTMCRKYSQCCNERKTNQHRGYTQTSSQLEDIKREYGKKNPNSRSLASSLLGSNNKEAMEYLTAKGYKSTQAVEGDIKKEQQKLENLSEEEEEEEEEAKSKEGFQEQVKELKENTGQGRTKLNDKIRQCEHEIAKFKKKFWVHLLKCCTNQSDKNGNENSDNETKEDEKKKNKTENKSAIPLRQETTNTLGFDGRIFTNVFYLCSKSTQFFELYRK
ncbi:hypothetical protein RFI_38352 [Reticulomyxa filosa]|uniref:Uncharacterized protein n=1 Tax=Reticulomyxa filosa TaxID=46433 RepID=X6LCN2_RETFI|nr:hypothetical protein RFI_38352 [Reticulomyxa filosa]|eukprot:ETN99130.1 hypothetical protein RFI_38352 [Reticulomyxa filosa]